jgi:hypothetical protein
MSAVAQENGDATIRRLLVARGHLVKPFCSPSNG